MNKIYMDHSATTPVAPEVVAAMTQALASHWGNPSSLHSIGEEARRTMENARKQVAGLIGADAQEIVFTSGGTEADNLAIIGTAWDKQQRGRHLISSSVEHHAVLNAFQFLAQNGFEVTLLPVDRLGRVHIDTVQDAIREDTTLISIMHANNEIGSLQPIDEIGQLARSKGIIFHTDAVQSVGRIPIDVKKLKVDLLSLSSHKFYGPKGVGALYIRSGINLAPLTYGGGQEKKWRSGTENIPGIVGLGTAAELARRQMLEHLPHLQELGTYLIERILNEIPNAYLTGHPEERLPGHASFVFPGVEGASLLTFLDGEGIAASSAAACSSNTSEVSHVLKAIGLKEEFTHNSLRLSLGKDNTRKDIDRLMEILPGLVERLRLLWSLI